MSAEILEDQTQQTPTNDWQQLYESQQKRVEELERIIAAGRINQTPVDKNWKPAMTAERLRALWGERRYNTSSETDRLTAIGVEPNIDRGLLVRLFGLASQGNDGREATELMRTNPARYRLLKEAAKALRIA